MVLAAGVVQDEVVIVVTLPLMGLFVASGVLAVLKLETPLQLPQLTGTVASGVATLPLVLIAHTGLGVALNVVQLDVIRYPAVSMCQVEQLVTSLTASVLQD